MDILARIDDWDWEQAFNYSDFNREDVAAILAIADGENDDSNWVGVFLLRDGSFGYLSAGCDSTGWGCRASGDSYEGNTLKDVLSQLTESDWERLGDQLARFTF